MAELSVVGGGAKKATKQQDEPLGLVDALDSGARDVLVSLRRLLAEKLASNDVSSNSLASVAKELRELDRQIRSIDAAESQEAQRRDSSSGPRRSFDSKAL